MNREDIIRMAREALDKKVEYSVWTVSTPHLEEFARLVAAAEREACAKMVEEWITHPHLAIAIRARGQE